jgi:hypothetical protein
MELDEDLSKLLTNSIWYVPTETLKAYLTINDTNEQVIDQTLWVIDSCEDGYFFGTSYTVIPNVTTSKKSFVGSITPYGSVLITFYSGNNTIVGSGTFSKINGEYQFVMQMNSIFSSEGLVLGISHWSYMRRVIPESYYYQYLPGVIFGVQEFLALFD